MRVLEIAIEDLADLYPRLYLEPHIVSCTAVLRRYAGPPATFDVKCEGVRSRWLGKADRFQLEVDWTAATAEKAERLRATLQSRPLVEMASVALAFVLARRVVPLGQLDVTDCGDRADYRSLTARRVLEISGTETLSELGRRHREKAAQALANPFGWDAYVVVCAFSTRGHRIRFTGHSREEDEGGET